MEENEYVKVLKHAPGLDMTGTRKMSELLSMESSSFATSCVVRFGAHKGFKLPIWDATGATALKQIHIKMRVPEQWNAKGDATVKLLFALSGTEATPSACQFRCLYDVCQSGGKAHATYASVDSGDVYVVSGSLATYSAYEATLTIPADDFVAGDYIGGLIRRIASSTGATGVMANDVIVLKGQVEWEVDKIYGVS